MKLPTNVIISRTDSVGDMILTLPMAAALKQKFPDITIGILGTEYTRSIAEACANVDVFIHRDDFLNQTITLKEQKPECIIHVLPRSDIAKRAKQLAIPWRIGTRNRHYHWLTCNKLLPLSRNGSSLHEAQLNMALLQPFGIKSDWSLNEIADLFALQKLPVLPDQFAALLQPNKFKLILHPKSRGSAREWDLSNFASLIESLDADKFQIFISGTAGEKPDLQPLLDKVGNRVTDIAGLMTLSEFIAFIAACDGLVACSTGPLHIAAALQKHALGIYPPMRPIHPQRWQPIGTKAQVFVLDKKCNDCRTNKAGCLCMQAIQPAEIKAALDLLYEQDFS